MNEQTLVFFKKTLLDHGKITYIPLIFVVNPGSLLTKPTFYRHREIVEIKPKKIRKRAKYQIPKNRTTLPLPPLKYFQNFIGFENVSVYLRVGEGLKFT